MNKNNNVVNDDKQFHRKKNKSLIKNDNTDDLEIKKIIKINDNSNDNSDDNLDDNLDDNFDVKKKKSSIKKNKNVSMLSLNNVNELLDIHIDYVNKLKNFQKKTNCALRLPNFPECISENIIKEYINIIEKRNCSSSTTCGDLKVVDGIKEIKIEVKCFTSTGPTSFGPTESWDEIYFLDGINFSDKQFKIYKLNLSNDSKKFKSIKINSDKTYEQVCKEGKRPRIGFKLLKDQLENDTKLVYDGLLNFHPKYKLFPLLFFLLQDKILHYLLTCIILNYLCHLVIYIFEEILEN